MNCYSDVLIATFVFAAHVVQCNRFWWVLLYEFLGSQMGQLLSRYGGACFVCYRNRNSWLICAGWLLYFHKFNELHYAITYLASQITKDYDSIQMICDSVDNYHDKICALRGELVECPTGRVVWLSVAPVEGEQPWLIAPVCMSQTPQGMKLSLSETFLLFLLISCLTEGVTRLRVLPYGTAMSFSLLDSFKQYTVYMKIEVIVYT